jgi:outer membrane protein OmpA-like peptidoglycan-associated protein
MSNSNSTTGSQTTQTVLVVLISTLLTALVVLLIGGKGLKVQASAAGDTTETKSSSVELDRDIADRIQRDAKLLTERLKTKEQALINSVNELEAAKSARDGITNQLVELKMQNQELMANAGQQSNLLDQLNTSKLQNERLLVENTNYLNQRENLQDELSKIKTENLKLQADLASQTAELESSAAKLQNALKNAESEGSGDEVLQAQLIAFKDENLSLKTQLANLRVELHRTKLFVKEDALSPRGQALYKSLSALKSQEAEALDLAYSKIQTELSVKKLRHVKFTEGSALVSELESDMILKDIADAAPDSLILVVGYASTTGTAESNYELSAQRATSTASVVFTNKPESQEVRAVFLGQTDRFDLNEPSANQVCEIWEIKKL